MVALSGVAWRPGLLAGESLGSEAIENSRNRFNSCIWKQIIHKLQAPEDWNEKIPTTYRLKPWFWGQGRMGVKMKERVWRRIGRERGGIRSWWVKRQPWTTIHVCVWQCVCEGENDNLTFWWCRKQRRRWLSPVYVSAWVYWSYIHLANACFLFLFSSNNYSVVLRSQLSRNGDRSRVEFMVFVQEKWILRVIYKYVFLFIWSNLKRVWLAK